MRLTRLLELQSGSVSAFSVLYITSEQNKTGVPVSVCLKQPNIIIGYLNVFISYVRYCNPTTTSK